MQYKVLLGVSPGRNGGRGNWWQRGSRARTCCCPCGCVPLPHAGRSRSRSSAAQLGGRSLLTHTNFTGNSCQLVPVSFDHERIFRGPNAIDLAVSLIDEHAHSCFMPCGSIRSGHGTFLVHRGAASPVCSADVDNIQLLRGARRIRRLPDTYCWRWRGAHWTMSSTRKIISAASVEDRTTWDFTL